MKQFFSPVHSSVWTSCKILGKNTIRRIGDCFPNSLGSCVCPERCCNFAENKCWDYRGIIRGSAIKVIRAGRWRKTVRAACRNQPERGTYYFSRRRLPKDRKVYKKGQAVPVCPRHATEKQDWFSPPCIWNQLRIIVNLQLLGIELVLRTALTFWSVTCCLN